MGWRLSIFAILAALMVACSAAPSKKSATNYDELPWGGDNEKPLNPPRDPDNVTDDGGAFGLEGRMSDGGGDPVREEEDAGTPPPPPKDGGMVNLCNGVSPGDFKIVEIMIASVSGSGDKGEWVEIQSTRSCTLNAKGLTISSPRGTLPADTVTINVDTFVTAYGTIVVANTTNPQLNHGLPGKVFAWTGEPADVLKNDGDTIDVKLGQTTIDTITYPKFSNLVAGSSVSFPWDCSWGDRPDWGRWSYSFKIYGGSYKGTPNADNFDVACY